MAHLHTANEFYSGYPWQDSPRELGVGQPIRMSNVLATLYRVLGIDPDMTFRDDNGRPQPILENREPVPGLL